MVVQEFVVMLTIGTIIKLHQAVAVWIKIQFPVRSVAVQYSTSIEGSVT